MSIEPQAPLRPLDWPPVVRQLAQTVEHADRVYLIGGSVRDALRGRASHDLDLATPDSGRAVARRIADRLGGKYYTLDPDRDVGRAILPGDEPKLVIDVASFRGGSLLDDLRGRDFTINAIAVRLDQLGAVIDPLSGQQDLFNSKILRPCSDASIADDPLRAIRALRCSMQFGMRMEPATIGAVRQARGALFDPGGQPAQPERIRDEIFKLLALPRPADALRILDRLGLLAPFGLLPTDHAATVEKRLTLVEILSNLLNAISPSRNDDTAADLLLGTAVMILDRYRASLQAHLSAAFVDERRHAELLVLAGVSLPGSVNWRKWAVTYCLSNPEKSLLVSLDAARQALPGLSDPSDRRAIYRYFKPAGEAGVDAVLLMLAEYLAANLPTPSALAWGNLLEHAAAPLLDAFFNHHAEQIAPAPLLTGDDLQQQFGLTPSPQLGEILSALVEEQAAGQIETQKEAIQFVERFLRKQSD